MNNFSLHSTRRKQRRQIIADSVHAMQRPCPALATGTCSPKATTRHGNVGTVSLFTAGAAAPATSFSELFANTTERLNRTESAQGIELFGSDTNLGCLKERLLNGQAVTVVALGGSISAGSSFRRKHGAGSAYLYHAKLVRAMRLAFPTANISRINAAMPATGPAWFEHCLDDLMISTVHLVLVEFAVNVDGQHAAFERMLRKLLLRQPSVAVLVVSSHMFPLWRDDGRPSNICWKRNATGKNAIDTPAQSRQQHWRDAAGNGDEDAIAALCEHYNVPLVSMRAGLLPAVRSGVRSPSSIMDDCRHPNGDGHTFLAQMAFARLLSAAPPPIPCVAAIPAPRKQMRSPLHSDGHPYAAGTSQCAHGLRLMKLATSRRNFRFTDEDRGKPGFVATRPGASMSFCLYEPSASERGDTSRSARPPPTPRILPPPSPTPLPAPDKWNAHAASTLKKLGRGLKNSHRSPGLRSQQEKEPCRDGGWPLGLARGANALARARAGNSSSSGASRSSSSIRMSTHTRAGIGRSRPWRPLPKCSGAWFSHPPAAELLHSPVCITSAGDTRDFAAPESYCFLNRHLCGAVPHVLKACAATCGVCAVETITGNAHRLTAQAGHDPTNEKPSSAPSAPPPLGLWIGYLSSYEGMGRVSVHCTGICRCAAVVDAHRSDVHTSVTAVQRLVVQSLPRGIGADSKLALARATGNSSKAGCCGLELKVLGSSSSKGHKFKVSSLLLAQRGHRDDWNPPGIGRKIALAFDRVMDVLSDE